MCFIVVVVVVVVIALDINLQFLVFRPRVLAFLSVQIANVSLTNNNNYHCVFESFSKAELEEF